MTLIKGYSKGLVGIWEVPSLPKGMEGFQTPGFGPKGLNYSFLNFNQGLNPLLGLVFTELGVPKNLGALIDFLEVGKPTQGIFGLRKKGPPKTFKEGTLNPPWLGGRGRGLNWFPKAFGERECGILFVILFSRNFGKAHLVL